MLGGLQGRGTQVLQGLGHSVTATVVASQGAAYLWEDPKHRAATMETPWLGKPMATPTSTWKPPAHGNARSAVSTRTTPCSPRGSPPPRHAHVQPHGGMHQVLRWGRRHPGGGTQPWSTTVWTRAGVSTHQELVLELAQRGGLAGFCLKGCGVCGGMAERHTQVASLLGGCEALSCPGALGHRAALVLSMPLCLLHSVPVTLRTSSFWRQSAGESLPPAIHEHRGAGAQARRGRGTRFARLG